MLFSDPFQALSLDLEEYVLVPDTTFSSKLHRIENLSLYVSKFISFRVFLMYSNLKSLPFKNC